MLILSHCVPIVASQPPKVCQSQTSQRLMRTRALARHCDPQQGITQRVTVPRLYLVHALYRQCAGDRDVGTL